MDNLHQFVALAALLSLGALAPACTSGGTVSADSFLADEDYSGASSDGFPAPSKEMVWDAAMTVVRRAGYVPDPNLSQAKAGTVETRWRMKLHPFSGMGVRERVTVRVSKVPKKRNYYRLETNVLAQANDNIKQPGNPIRAEWTEGKRNTMIENMINQRVELRFLKGDVSSQFRRRHSMPKAKDNRMEFETPAEPAPLIPGFPDLR